MTSEITSEITSFVDEILYGLVKGYTFKASDVTLRTFLLNCYIVKILFRNAHLMAEIYMLYISISVVII